MLKQGVVSMLLALSSVASFATVGGKQTIEILGYEPNDQKVYLLRHFDDGCGRLPQLYYYDLASSDPQKLVAVRSLYAPLSPDSCDAVETNVNNFNKRLANMTRRLSRLNVDDVPNSVEVLGIEQKRVPAWLGGKTYEYQISYRLRSHDDNYQSNKQTITAYDVFLTSDNNVYSIPNQPYLLTKVTYTGTDMELRYQYQDAVLLKPID